MNKEQLYKSIMESVSKEIKKHLNETRIYAPSHTTPLKVRARLSNVELAGSIFNSYDYKDWYESFVEKGGGCYMTGKVFPANVDKHTFIVNTKEAAKMLVSFIKREGLVERINLTEEWEALLNASK